VLHYGTTYRRHTNIHTVHINQLLCKYINFCILCCPFILFYVWLLNNIFKLILSCSRKYIFLKILTNFSLFSSIRKSLLYEQNILILDYLLKNRFAEFIYLVVKKKVFDGVLFLPNMRLNLRLYGKNLKKICNWNITSWIQLRC